MNCGEFDESKKAKMVELKAPMRGRFFKLVALSSYTRHASLAELTLLKVEE